MEARWERCVEPLETAASRDLDDFSQASVHRPLLAYSYNGAVPLRMALTSLSVSASGLHLLRLITTPSQPGEALSPATGGTPLPADSQALQELQGQPAGSETNDSAGPADAASRIVVHGWEDMGTVKRVSVFQAPVPPSSCDDRRRPIMVIADSTRLIITETTRCGCGLASI